MIIIHPDGRFEEKPYVDYRSIVAAVNTPQSDDPFTTVPIAEGPACGHVVFANDNGLLTGLVHNTVAEALCGYGPIVGPVVVATFEETNEDELLGGVSAAAKASFVLRLNEIRKALQAAKMQAENRQAARMN